jgi:hypothetical protein
MMQEPYIQLAPITLRPHVSEAELLAASDAFERNFVSKQKGIIRRQLLRSSRGGYADLVIFENKQAADKVLEAELASPECAAYFSLMETPDENLPDMGISSFEHIKTYE